MSLDLKQLLMDYEGSITSLKPMLEFATSSEDFNQVELFNDLQLVAGKTVFDVRSCCTK